MEKVKLIAVTPGPAPTVYNGPVHFCTGATEDAGTYYAVVVEYDVNLSAERQYKLLEDGDTVEDCSILFPVGPYLLVEYTG